MTEHLLPCPSCNRHVRAHERDCPHCGKALPETTAARSAAAQPVRLSRAALVALGAGATMAIGACSTASEMPIYGAPPVPWEDSGASSPDASGDAQKDVDAPREDAAPDDAGERDGSSDAADADR